MKFEIQGAKEFDDLLQQLPAAVQRRVAGNALRAGGRIARDAAKRLAPVGDPSESVADYGVGSRARALTERGRGGRLRRSIRVITARFASIPLRTFPPAFGRSASWFTSTIPLSAPTTYSSAS